MNCAPKYDIIQATNAAAGLGAVETVGRNRMIQWLKRFSRLFSKEHRAASAEKHPVRNAAFMALFPVFLVLIVEMNHLQSVTALCSFVTRHFGVFLFDVFLTGAVFAAVLALVRAAWIAAAGVGTLFFLLSCVEFFKFDVSGSHFLPHDLVLAGKLSTVAGMAQLRMTAVLAVDLILFVVILLTLFCTGASFRLRWGARIGLAAGCLIAAAAVIVTPASTAVFRLFAVDHRSSANTFVANEKFESDNLIAFWSSELAHLASNRIEKPEPYDASSVQALLGKTAQTVQPARKPNVIIIMSESYADFRVLDSNLPQKNAYTAFDAFCADGISGFAVVPTFGGYTGRSEFELLTGLPVAAIQDPIVPHDAIQRDTVEGIPELFRRRGYQTVYLHPYQRDFYDRASVYPSFGFDQLLFEDELAIGDRIFHNRPEDALCFDRAISLLRETEEPVFLFVTTMQNHQPYYYDADQGVDELAYYMEGLAHTDAALDDFRQSLDTLGEDTIVLYIGDHFPFFGLPGNFYEQMHAGVSNCAVYYRQHYFLYANYPLEAGLDSRREELSLFYLPHLLLATAFPEDIPAISAAFLTHAETKPVYTTADLQTASGSDSFLDTLAYDRLIGRAYSAER